MRVVYAQGLYEPVAAIEQAIDMVVYNIVHM